MVFGSKPSQRYRTARAPAGSGKSAEAGGAGDTFPFPPCPPAPSRSPLTPCHQELGSVPPGAALELECPAVPSQEANRPEPIQGPGAR